jgi:hypothetical protein
LSTKHRVLTRPIAAPRRAGLPRVAVATIVAATLLAVSVSPASAGTSAGSGRFAEQADPNGSGHVACGVWGVRLDTNTGGYSLHLKSSTTSRDGYFPNCPDNMGLPAAYSKTRVRGYLLVSGGWSLQITGSLNGNASGSAYVASELDYSNVAQGYWYPDGGHDLTIWSQFYKQSGGSGMAEYYDSPYE